MVLKKRLNFGFRGYDIPVIPRAPRSVRRRGSHKRSVDDQQICAFELLADVAGKLLQESESSASSNASETKAQPHHKIDGTKQERVEEIKPFRSECIDQGSCVESTIIPDFVAGDHNLRSTLNDHLHAESDSLLEHTSIVTSSDFSKKVDCDLKLRIYNDRNVDENISHRKEGVSHKLQDLCKGKLESGMERQVLTQIGDLTVANSAVVKNQTENCMNTKPLINSDTSVQLSLYRDPVPRACFPKHRNHVNLGIRDNDGNSFRCNKFNSKIKAFRPQVRSNYRRIKKMLTSKYWKAAHRLRDYEASNTSEGMRSFYRSRKIFHTRERNLCEAPPKRRKLCDQSLVFAYDEDASSESISNSPEKGEYSRSDAILHKANGASTSVKVNRKPKNSSVKFSIKSFKVPGLYIEVPETATVGSLKRTVMETVTAILGGGLRVGVVLRGKKVRDDSRTLQQAGISHGGNLDSLGFVLEPSFIEVNEPPKDCSPLLQCDAGQKLVGPTATPFINPEPLSAKLDSPSMNKTDKQLESNTETMISPRIPADDVTDGLGTDSKALVPLPTINTVALALVPMNPKIKRSESSQRRTRRPFSVNEVEALVEAVEILGTGRWRDVKMRAFDNADHRTYVDLKDKWKTLVHTASISPQQRRGEPVPQELLDRVLSAHSYWYQHQSKQHGKHQLEPLQTVEAPAQEVEV